jgi:uncharacterized delta-60 repeat protein
MKKVILLFNIIFFQLVVLGQAGSPDVSFQNGYPAFWFNYSDIQSDDKIVISNGPPSSPNHTLRRFLSNGDVDTTFNIAQVQGGDNITTYPRIGVLDVHVLPDDRILVAGAFDYIFNHGHPANGNSINLARLHPNGMVDNSFYYESLIPDEAITTIFINNNDEIIIGGKNVFERISENGMQDGTFAPNFFGFGNTIETIDQFSNGNYLIGGNLTANYGSYLMRCFPNGDFDLSWNAGNQFNGSIKKVIIQPDQKILVAGNFSQFNGIPVNRICRLNANGTLDMSFNVGTGANGSTSFRDMQLQPDGKIILGAFEMTSFNGYTCSGTVRLHSDGSVDTSYGALGSVSLLPGVGQVEAILQLPDSKIIVGGYFMGFNYYAAGSYSSVSFMRLLTCTESTELQSISACDSLTWIDGNTYYSDNNTATYTYTSIGGCDSTITLDLTISPSPTSDMITDLTSCESYQLPLLSAGEYYTESNGGGTQLGQGDLITSTQTIYIYSSNGTCSTENTFTISIDQPVIADAPIDVIACENYVLPDLSVGNYYTATNGGGTPLAAGDLVSTEQTLYVFAENGTCFDENSFVISLDTPIFADAPIDITACEHYALPTLSTGTYYTASNGGGIPMTEGNIISTSQTLYVYAENGTCSNENEFHISIDQMPSTNVIAIGNTLTATQSGANYQWLDCNNGNSPIIGENGQSYTASASGSYAVQIDLGTCSSTSDCHLVEVLGVSEMNNTHSVRVYPNPTDGEVIISLPNNEPAWIEIYSSLGVLERKFHTNQQENTIQISGNSGVYFVRVSSMTYTETLRLVKK